MSRIFKSHDRYWNGIAVYGDYLPWGVHRAAGGDRSNYPERSGKMLDLKEGKDAGVAYFSEAIATELKDEIVIATVPSHNPEKPGVGLKKLVAELVKDSKRVDASGSLVRTQKIDKLAAGGNRSKDVHLKSVSVALAPLIKGRDVLLLDDVTKTGNSLLACRDLLLAAGARSVECATIGKT